MIKTAELRVGNWACFPGGHYPHYAQATDFEMLEYFSRNGYPIPLTPEILESAGFEIINPHFSYLMYKNKTTSELTVFLAHDEKGFTFVMDADYPEFVDCSLPFQYVHQLQNLYYALTGSELEIKAMSPSASQTL